MAQALAAKRGINNIARKHVIGTLRELMSDPDQELLLRADFVRRLKRSVQSKRSGKYKNLDHILKRYL